MKILDQNLKKFKSKSETLEDEMKKSWIHLNDLLRQTETLGGEILRLSKAAINDSIKRNFNHAAPTIRQGDKTIIAFNVKITLLKKELARCVANSNIEIGKIGELKILKLDEDFLNAREEFLEAYFLFIYLKTGKLPNLTNPLLQDFRIYAGALADFCGELIRRARLSVIEGKDPTSEVEKYRKLLNEIYQSLSGFAFSNRSGVRGKVEHLKGYIGELENILYTYKVNSK